MPVLDSGCLAQVGCGPARGGMACLVSLLGHVDGNEVTACHLDRALTAFSKSGLIRCEFLGQIQQMEVFSLLSVGLCMFT